MVYRKMLERVREELILKMEELQVALSRSSVCMKDGADRMADVMDLAAAEQDLTVELVIRGRQCEQIREIRETIHRIDQGLFGVCFRCGMAISPKRLLLAPMSRLCTSCTQELEPGSQVGYRPAHSGGDRYAS